MKWSRFLAFMACLTLVLTAAASGVSAMPLTQLAQPMSTYVPNKTMPDFFRQWYGVTNVTQNGSGQTIAVIGTGNYTKAASDLAVFNSSYKRPVINGVPGAPACTISDGPYPCFERVVAPPSDAERPTLYFSGGTAYQAEAGADIQWAHVIAPGANILFVDAATAAPDDIIKAVDVAVEKGASVVSISLGWTESAADVARNEHFSGVPGVVFVAASGDEYYDGAVKFPASSPSVLGVGGTTLKSVCTPGGCSKVETAWGKALNQGSIGSTGGLSAVFSEPGFQSAFQSSGWRGIPDVAYTADGYGFPCYVLGRYTGYGGTSLGAPQWAGIIALANQARAEKGLAPLTGVEPIYQAAASGGFKDITEGYGACMTDACKAGPGYDFATGLGSPKANSLVPALAEQ